MSQSVCLLVSLDAGCLWIILSLNNSIIGEWSDVKSQMVVACMQFGQMAFTTKKSIQSGYFSGSLGQYVGEPSDKQVASTLFIPRRRSMPLPLVNLEPQYWCFALKSPPNIYVFPI